MSFLIGMMETKLEDSSSDLSKAQDSKSSWIDTGTVAVMETRLFPTI